MAKYTLEEKLQATLSYLEDKDSLQSPGQSIGTDHEHKAILRLWGYYHFISFFYVNDRL